MKFLIKLITSAAAISLLAYLLPGVHIEGQFMYAVLIALLISVLNAVVRPILIFLTLPATLITMGAFLIIINAVVVFFADKLMDGFIIDNFWWTLLFSILLSIINSVVQKMIKENKHNKPNQKGNGKVIVIESN